MKKNDMLNESTIRRFMKLATIDGLSDKFVDEKLQESEEQELEERGMMKPKRDDDEEMREGEEDLEEMRADKRDDDEMREGADEDLEEGKHEDDEMREAADEELDEMRDDKEEMDEISIEEEEMDMGLGDDKPAAGGMVSVDQLMSALEKALEDVLGQEVEVSQDDDEMEMDMDLDMDAADDAEPAMDMDDEKEDDEDMDLGEAAPKTDVVEEVYARVIQRLTQETKSNKK